METQTWLQGRTAALSFTFDDARQTQLANAIPCLNNYGIQGTFYVLHKNVKHDVEGWRQAVEQGHEIGNHTMTHPCSGNFAHSRHRALEHFSRAQMEDEILEANRLIEGTLGIAPQTFAYPCGNSFVGRGSTRQSYVPLVAQYFKAGRATLNSGNAQGICDVFHLHAVGIDRADGAALTALIDQARANNEWLILYGHELGDSQGSGMPLAVFDHLCRYARECDDLWIDTVARIAPYAVE